MTTRTLTTAELTIPAPARLLTTNRSRTLHWSYRADIAREWRKATKIYAMQQHLPVFSWAKVTFEIHQAKGKLADADAHHPVTKAVLDGLVDAGVLLGDDPEHVPTISRLAPVRGVDAVVVRLSGELA